MVTAITAIQDYPHQDFAPLIVFIISIEVYSDILTGGYAVTTIIYSYIFCIYRYYNNILLVTLYDCKSPIANGLTMPISRFLAVYSIGKSIYLIDKIAIQSIQ